MRRPGRRFLELNGPNATVYEPKKRERRIAIWNDESLFGVRRPRRRFLELNGPNATVSEQKTRERRIAIWSAAPKAP
ncbi:MAG: hypothetical protein ACKO38_09025, partial [Planctomycetota bacterium]